MSILVHKAPVGKLAQNIEVDNHTVLTDVPEKDGGDSLAPDPHDLLDGAYAACTALTLKMYANRKGWPLDDARITVTHEESPGHYRLNRQVELVGNLNEEQRQRLLEIANKCPIHRVLTGEITTETVLAS